MGSMDAPAGLTCREAGRLGGLSTLARYGQAHYREIGSKGQAALSARHGREERSLWGSQGGRPKRRRYNGAGTEQVEGREGEPARGPGPVLTRLKSDPRPA